MTSETHENPALTPIFSRAVTLAVKGPGVLSGYVFLRGAAAAASWLPPLMVIMALVRILRTAPKDAMGEPRFMDMLSAMLSEPLFLAGAVGIYVSIVAIRAVLLALAEAGLYGEFATAWRANRKLGFGGFLANALRLFGRFAVYRMLFEAVTLGLLLLLGIVVLWASPSLALIADYRELLDEDMPYLAGLLAILVFSAIVYSVLALYLIAAQAVAAVEDLPLVEALVVGWRQLQVQVPSMLVFLALTFTLGVWFSLLGTLGEILWLRLQFLSESRLLTVASSAWSLSFFLVGQFMILISAGCQVMLFAEKPRH